MGLRLDGKAALVTGASKGIGRAIATRLAAEGMHVLAVARNGQALDELSKETGGRCSPFPADLSREDAPAKAVAAAVERFGGLDLLVNNAGSTKRGDFLELTEADWTDGFALKFFGAVRAARAAWPYLAFRKGAIVSIVGVGGRTGTAEFAIGGSVNAGLLNLTKVLADRGVSAGVRVNAINPGWIATDRLEGRVQNFMKEHGVDRAESERQLTTSLGIARFGKPEEIANAVAFLASDQAAYLQGAILDVDGGLTRTL